MEKCFAQQPGKAWCAVLNGQRVPEDCVNCKFKKPDRDVTDGKRYPTRNTGTSTYIPKYPIEGD